MQCMNIKNNSKTKSQTEFSDHLLAAYFVCMCVCVHIWMMMVGGGQGTGITGVVLLDGYRNPRSWGRLGRDTPHRSRRGRPDPGHTNARCQQEAIPVGRDPRRCHARGHDPKLYSWWTDPLWFDTICYDTQWNDPQRRLDSIRNDPIWYDPLWPDP